jgi:hypothetical protein
MTDFAQSGVVSEHQRGGAAPRAAPEPALRLAQGDAVTGGSGNARTFKFYQDIARDLGLDNLFEDDRC